MREPARTEHRRSTSYAQVLGNRGFVLLVLAYGINTFGNWVTVVAALALATFKWQASPLALGGMIAIFLVPTSVLGPMAGWLADRLDKRALLIAANVVGGCVILGMLFVQTLWQAYIVLAVLKTVTAVNQPAMMALVPALVRPREIMAANAIVLQPAHATRALSPLIAGVLVGTVGASAAFALDAVTFALASFVVWSIPAGARGAAAARPNLQPPISAASEAGARSENSASRVSTISIPRGILSPRLLTLVLLAVAGSFAFGALESLTPVYVRDLLNGRPMLYGATVSSLGLGSIVGALAAGRLCQSLDRLSTVVLGSFLIGLGLFMMAAIHSAGSLLAGAALAGSGAGVALTAGQSLVQEESLARLHGTVLGSLWAVSNTATVAGIFLTAAVISFAGAALSAWAVCLFLLTVVVIGWQFERRLRLSHS